MENLYIVATPIGNLGDMTFRAIEVLRSVDYVVCEDSRRTGILLQKLQISNNKLQINSKFKNSNYKLISIHEHSQDSKIDWLIDELSSGKSAAMVTDAGTPGIADPGGRVVEKAIEAGINVVPIPGPSSLATMLSITGWQNEPVLFLGYLPKKKGRQTLLSQISNRKSQNSKLLKTLVFFDSPNRINKTIKELVEYLGEDCQVVIGRELTKQFEEIIRGRLGELSKIELKKKGEFVVAIKLI